MILQLLGVRNYLVLKEYHFIFFFLIFLIKQSHSGVHLKNSGENSSNNYEALTAYSLSFFSSLAGNTLTLINGKNTKPKSNFRFYLIF